MKRCETLELVKAGDYLALEDPKPGSPIEWPQARKAHRATIYVALEDCCAPGDVIAFAHVSEVTGSLAVKLSRMDLARKVVDDSLDEFEQLHGEDFPRFHVPEVVNVNVVCADCGCEFVTASDHFGACPKCGGQRRPDG